MTSLIYKDMWYMKASEAKPIWFDYIWYGVNSLKPGGLDVISLIFHVLQKLNNYITWENVS